MRDETRRRRPLSSLICVFVPFGRYLLDVFVGRSSKTHASMGLINSDDLVELDVVVGSV